MWKRAVYYGLFLAAGTLVSQWLDYQRLARAHSNDIYILLVALALLALAIFIGVRAFRATPPANRSHPQGPRTGDRALTRKYSG